MKSRFMNRLHVAAISVAVTSSMAQASEPAVAVNTAGMPDYLRARVEAKAQQGVTELRRYLDSTKHIHGLRVEFVVKSR
jgi:hypothetical protein